MPRVEPGRIGTLKPLHTRDKIACRRLQQEMIVIIHQHVAVHHKPSPFADLPKSRQEVLPILIVQENRLAPIAPAQQMIEGALILDACSTRHLLFKPCSRLPAKLMCTYARTDPHDAMPVKLMCTYARTDPHD